MWVWRGSACVWYVSYIRCPQALAMPYAIRQYQKRAMQCNAIQWQSSTLEKSLRHASFLAYDVVGCSPCHPVFSSEHIVGFVVVERYKS